MPLILSQRINFDSNYQDIPFKVYHYPKKYRNKIKSGDIFIYHQGDKKNPTNRFYYGYGVVGQISSMDGENYFAEIIGGTPFPYKVPLKYETSQYYENFGDGYNERKKPDWQNAIRFISHDAFNLIIEAAHVSDIQSLYDISNIESISEPLMLISKLNKIYSNYNFEMRNKIVSEHLDRGTSVTNALKKILGPNCQICGEPGFEKKDGTRYIEAHHLIQLSKKKLASLCSDNIILLCSNCHKEIHHGKHFSHSADETKLYIELGAKRVSIQKNTIDYLKKLEQCQALVPS
ncbi:HNH endonuclease [Paenibacillus sp. FSL K6-2393]|uniref:HNH endonuclease n=1 Tax=Paenibacillus sp. FSL K6-2393 TaxID=2921475 RepID=UPI0030F8A8B8